MKTKTASILFLAALAALFTFATARSTTAADKLQDYDLAGITAVDFYISKSNVTLVGEDRADLELSLEKPGADFDPEKAIQTVTRVGDTLKIKVEYAKEKSSWLSWGDDYQGYKSATLRIPAKIEVHIKTSGGNISAKNMASSTTLNTSGGNITVADISGPVQIKTSGGNIHAENLIGSVDLHTSGGNININGEIPSLNAHTSGGHINAKLHSRLLEPLVLKTSGGNVNATLSSGMQAPAQLSTSGGNVSISLPHDQAFELYAKSNGGGVSLKHNGTFQGTHDKRKIEGNINGGGPLLKLTTNGGRVNIQEI